MQERLEIRTTGTLLSRSPRELSGLIAAICLLVVLLVSTLGWRDPELLRRLSASPQPVFAGGEIWRLVTAIFVHADFQHFLANSILLTLFVYLLYGYFGFWICPVSVTLLGALVNYCSLLTYAPDVQLVGASGVVYLMAAFWLTSYVLIERTRSSGRRLLHAVGVALIVLIPTNVPPNVSHRTHAIGCGIGILAAVSYFLARKSHIRSQETIEIQIME